MAWSFNLLTHPQQDQNVTIVHAQSLLLNNAYPDRWRKRVARDLEARGVKLVLGEYVDEPEVKDGQISTRTKKSINADLIVRPYHSFK